MAATRPTPSSDPNIVDEEFRQTEADLSIQARATKAPFEAGVPGTAGPFSGDGAFGPGGFLLQLGSAIDEIRKWSYYPMLRDKQLRQFWKTESLMAGTVYALTSRLGSLEYQVEADSDAAEKLAKEMIHDFDVRRWCVDYLTTDNGAFVEKLGPGDPLKPLKPELVRGFSVMDSMQCWRSFDPEFPVIYVNPYTAAYHRIHASRVIMTSSMPQPDELARGIGFCPVSRALRMAQIARDIAVYKHEKISGRFKRAIGSIEGVTPKTVKTTLTEHDEAMDAKGFTRYNEIPFLVSMSPIKIALTDLAQLPDGFDFTADLTTYVHALALAFGVDAREIWPSGGGSGGSRADATVQHEKARGKGIGDIIAALENIFNFGGLQPGVSMYYDFTDDAEDLAQAQLQFQRITNVATIIQAGIITPKAGYDMLVEEEIIDPDVVPEAAPPPPVPIPGLPGVPGKPPVGVQKAGPGNAAKPGMPAKAPGLQTAAAGLIKPSKTVANAKPFATGGKEVDVPALTEVEIQRAVAAVAKLPTLAELRRKRAS